MKKHHGEDRVEDLLLFEKRASAPPIALLLSSSLIIAALASACGSDEENDEEPPNGETEESVSTETIGPEGGSISAGACWVSFPQGAVESEVDITLSELDEPPHEGFEPLSPVCLIEPADLALQAPVNIKLRFEGAEEIAALFHDREDSGRYHRIGGAADGRWIGAYVSSLGRFFVGNGFDYEDPADMDCIATRLLGGREYPDFSSVALHVAAEDCAGRLATGLTHQDLLVRENASEVESLTSLSSDSHQPLVTLLLDTSSPMQPVMAEVVDAAQEVFNVLMDEDLQARVSVEMYAGGEESTVWMPHRLLDAELRENLTDILFDMPDERHDPNLHGAVIGALTRLREARDEVEEWNHGGVFTSGHVILLVSQEDGAGLESLDAAAEAVETARADGVYVHGVGLHGGDLEPATLLTLAPDGMSTARGPRLGMEARFIAGEIARVVQSALLTAYCSDQTGGSHSASVEVDGPADSEPAVFELDATGFEGSCDEELLDEACLEAQCGGLGCGACDDRETECDPETLTCVSFCERPEFCGGDTFTNPRGYEQTCPEEDTNTRCGDLCVDITSNTSHCGECFHECNDGFICENGSCVCPDGLTDCDGVCRDTQSDPDHCGFCDFACAEGALCEEGDCVCPGDDGRVCDGVCRDVANDPENCGDCGVVCAEEHMAGCAHGFCSGPMWPSTPMPNPASSGLPNPADYEASLDTVSDEVTGVVWQRSASEDLLDWDEAKAYCRELEIGGVGGWRLPSRIELISIIDFTESGPAIDSDAFPGTPPEWFWSKSPRAGTDNQAWAVEFERGDSGTIMASGAARARCVKD